MIVKTIITLEGVDNVVALLRQLPPNVAGKLVKPAMRAAGEQLAGQLHVNAYMQLMAAQAKGYKRKKPGPHLFETVATRAKTYRKGETTFVAVGFNYQKGGRHAHLVELGHRIVKGGTLEKGEGRLPGLTAAGKRWLHQHGLRQGDYTIPRTGRGRGLTKSGKVRMKKARGAWQYIGKRKWLGMKPGQIFEGGQIRRTVFGRTVRGGGRLTGGVTREFPMLRPAFDKMKSQMVRTIENELRKIEAEARWLSYNPQKRAFYGTVI